MTPRAASSRHALELCTLQLHSWSPFHAAKKLCRGDRSTAPPADPHLDPSPRWIARKRRQRRASRSLSGRSSDRSGSLRRGSAASAAYATCSDFPLAAGGTDSSGEMFVNGDGGSWGSDASEVRVSKEVHMGAVTERESSGFVPYQGGGLGGTGVLDSQGNESGYGSEPGYRGDIEFGYGDELDEEEDDGRPMFWGQHFMQDADPMDIIFENEFSEQKAHHRSRRKKHDWRIIAPL